jgi:hypothetical protein
MRYPLRHVGEAVMRVLEGVTADLGYFSAKR